MIRDFHAMICKALVVPLVAVGLNAIATPLTSAHAQDASAKATAANGLAATLSARGRVSVIVQLSGDFQSEHALAGPEGVEASVAVAMQRAAIRQGQDRVLSDLAGTSVSSTKRFKYTPLMGMSVDGPGLQALVDSPNVVSISEDRPLPPTLADSVPLVGGDVSTGFPLGLSNFTGAGQTIAIIDSGVQSSHPFLPSKVVSEACYSSDNLTLGSTSVCPGGLAESTAVGSGENCDLSILGCDHGTHVAGIAAGQTTDVSGILHSGVAKDAGVIAIQVFSSFDATLCGALAPCALSYVTDQIKGLERVYELRGTYNIAAVNMSLGGGQYSSFCDGDPTKPIIDLLRAAGIATVIASGNDGFENSVSSPACISSAVTVGSSTKTDQVSSFSNNSPSMVDLLAPGSAINSSVPVSSYVLKNGTSMATPHVAGAFAVLKSSKPTATVSELENALRSTGTTVSETRLGVLFSKPRINVALALAFEPTDSIVADFNADTMSDILFRNGDGRAVVWQMNGMIRESAALIGNPPPAWRIEEIGDANGDGHADILWRHTGSNALAIWLMDGFTRIDAAVIGSVPTVWEVEGFGDFDGDTFIDILWRHRTTGNTVIWQMSGLTKVAAQSIGSPPTFWQIEGIADFNGDAKADIVWRNSGNGVTVVWEMNSFTMTAASAISAPAPVWEIEGVADFNGGGQPDLLWRNSSSGSLAVWQMNGYVKEASAIVGAPPLSWRTARLGDYNGGGQADIMFHRPSDGSVAIWQMNGIVKETSAVVGAPAGWTPQ